MSKMFDMRDSIALKSSDRINMICKPLFDKFDISYFRYYKVFKNNSRMMLCSHANLIKYFYEEGKYVLSWNDGFKVPFIKVGWTNWEILKCFDKHNDTTQFGLEIYKLFHLCYGQQFVCADKNCLEIYEFSSGTPTMYYYNLGIFRKFIYYFRQEASQLIHSSERIHIPLVNNQKNIEIAKILNISDNEDFLLKKYHLEGKYEGLVLSQREVECLSYLSKGKSAEEIAHIHRIRKKTVERHLDNIKKKLGCYKQTQLVSISHELEIF